MKIRIIAEYWQDKTLHNMVLLQAIDTKNLPMIFKYGFGDAIELPLDVSQIQSMKLIIEAIPR